MAFNRRHCRACSGCSVSVMPCPLPPSPALMDGTLTAKDLRHKKPNINGLQSGLAAFAML